MRLSQPSSSSCWVVWALSCIWATYANCVGKSGSYLLPHIPLYVTAVVTWLFVLFPFLFTQLSSSLRLSVALWSCCQGWRVCVCMYCPLFFFFWSESIFILYLWQKEMLKVSFFFWLKYSQFTACPFLVNSIMLPCPALLTCKTLLLYFLPSFQLQLDLLMKVHKPWVSFRWTGVMKTRWYLSPPVTILYLLCLLCRVKLMRAVCRPEAVLVTLFCLSPS